MQGGFPCWKCTHGWRVQRKPTNALLEGLQQLQVQLNWLQQGRLDHKTAAEEPKAQSCQDLVQEVFWMTLALLGTSPQNHGLGTAAIMHIYIYMYICMYI